MTGTRTRQQKVTKATYFLRTGIIIQLKDAHTVFSIDDCPLVKETVSREAGKRDILLGG